MIKFFLLIILLFIKSVNSYAKSDCQKLKEAIYQYNQELGNKPIKQSFSEDLNDDLLAWGIEFEGFHDQDGNFVIMDIGDGLIKIAKVSRILDYLVRWKNEFIDNDKIKGEKILFASDDSFLSKGNVVLKINGKSVKTLNQDEIFNEMKNFISINFLDSDGVERELKNNEWLEFKELLNKEEPSTMFYSHLKPTDVSNLVKTKTIGRLNTKSSEIFASLDLISTYDDVNLASFLEKKKVGTSTCSLEINEARNLGFSTNLYSPDYFIPLTEIIRKIEVSFTPSRAFQEFFKDDIGPEFTFEEKTNFTGNFKQEFNLSTFPFDKQRLLFYFVPNESIIYDFFNTLFEPEQALITRQELVDFNLTEWNIDFETADVGYGSKYLQEFKSFVPTVVIQFAIERKSGYFIYKILLPILIILIISWSVFWIRPQELESRITISIVCMLSLIAYNFVIDENLPKIGYLTLIDWFVFFAYVYSAIPTIQTVVVHNLLKTKKTQIEVIDEKSRYLVPTSFAGIIFIISVLKLYS